MLMYFVLVAQFGSFLDMLDIPLSLMGVVSAAALTGQTLNFASVFALCHCNDTRRNRLRDPLSARRSLKISGEPSSMVIRHRQYVLRGCPALS